jgi:hypothetical protein
MNHEEYRRAQVAMAQLKGAVVALLRHHPEGISNATIGRSLGIYAGHKGHEGHISRTLLAILEQAALSSKRLRTAPGPSDNTSVTKDRTHSCRYKWSGGGSSNDQFKRATSPLLYRHLP